VKAAKVDDKNRIRLPMLNPGDYYEAEFHGQQEILLRKVPEPKRQMSKEEILEALEASPISFTASWDELKEEIR